MAEESLLSFVYEPASWGTNVGRCQPGAVALSEFIRFLEPSFTNMGCFNDRAARGLSAPSLHREGRAIDIGANAFNPTQKAVMDRWCDGLIAARAKLGIQQIIWNQRSWRVGRNWLPYSGVSPHTDHAHIELTKAAAKSLTNQKLTTVFNLGTQADEGENLIDIGSRNSTVTELQLLLGFWAGPLRLPAPGAADGIFGEKTAASSRAFKAVMRESSRNPGALGDTAAWAAHSTWREYGAWLERIASLA